MISIEKNVSVRAESIIAVLPATETTAGKAVVCLDDGRLLCASASPSALKRRLENPLALPRRGVGGMAREQS